MKARLENGVIKIYSSLPSIFRGVTGLYPGGFHLQGDTIHRIEGFLDVVFPEFDPVLQTLGEIYYDNLNRNFTFYVIPVTLPPLSDAKAAKISELKAAVRELFGTIQWYVEMRRSEGEQIPQTLLDKIRLIKTRYEASKAMINSFTTVEDVLRYEITYATIENMKAELSGWE